MAFVKQFNDFKLFQPTQEEAASAEANLPKRLEINRNFLQKNKAVNPPQTAITGSFISAHAPDYIGVPTIHWNAEDWRKEFRIMKEFGLDTVILQAAAWKELQECYFPSKVLKDFTMFDVITPLIEAAQIENMALYLGGFGSVSGWDLQNKEKILQEIETHKAVLTELAELYGNKIAGFYFPCETAFQNKRNLQHEEQYGSILQEFFRIGRNLLPAQPIIMSPGSKYSDGMDEEFLACWKNLFADGAPDILAPQDSIGCGGSNLGNQHLMWQLWKKLADDIECRLWANIELFERRTFGGETPFDSASPERVNMQLVNVAPCVEKCVCWEFSYFVNGPANGAAELKKNMSLK